MKTKITVEKAKNGFILSSEVSKVKIVAATEKSATECISEDLSRTFNDMKDGDKKLIEFQITNI